MFRLKSTLIQFIVIDIIIIGVIMMFASRHRQLRHHDVRENDPNFPPNIGCPVYPDSLQGKLIVNASYKPTESEAVKNTGPHVKNGCYDPPECVANQALAVIVPFKNREQHLITLTHHLHPILQRQKLRYCIFVTEQYDDGAFNKARVMNAGVLELLKSGPFKFDCLIFYDVDMLVEDDRNLHRCLNLPHHLSPAIDKFNYTTGYGTDFGGVGAISPKQYFQINGHSNRFYGWGGEDSDLETRLHINKIDPILASHLVGRYKMIPHEHPWSFNPHTGTGSFYNSNSRPLKYRRGISTDDSGVSTIKYALKNVLTHRLYTKFTVDVRTFILTNAGSSFDDFNDFVHVENPFFTNTRNLGGDFDGKRKILGFGIEDDVTATNANCYFQNFPGKIIYHKSNTSKNGSDIYEVVHNDLNVAKNICLKMPKNCSAIMVKSPGSYVLRPTPFMHEKTLRYKRGPSVTPKIVSTVFAGESVYIKICEKDVRFLQILGNPVKINDTGQILRNISHKSKFSMQVFQAERFILYYDFTIYSTREAITRKYKILAVDSAIFFKKGRLKIFNSTDNATFVNFLGNYKNLDEAAQNDGILQVVTPPISVKLPPGSYICESSIIDGNDVTHLKWMWLFQVEGATKESEKLLMDKYLLNAELENSLSAREMLQKYRGGNKLRHGGDLVIWSLIFSQFGNIFEESAT